MLKISDIIIDLHCAFGRTENNCAAVRRPLDDFKLNLKFFTPKTSAFNGAHYDRAIFVDDANFFSVRGPAHVSNDGFVPVIDHFFKPVLLVHHPDNNEALLVRSG